MAIVGRIWKYEGSVDPSGKILTLETTGPCPMQGGKMTKFKDVVEIKDKDHRTFSSWVDFDGKMVQMLTINYTRKAATAAGGSPAGWPSGVQFRMSRRA